MAPERKEVARSREVLIRVIPDWQSNVVLISDLLPLRHPKIAVRLEEILHLHNIPRAIVPDTADIWIRDAAPVQVGPRESVQFRYWPDYLRDGFEHLITAPEVFQCLELTPATEPSDIVLDGGNVVGITGTAILTEKVFKENPNRSRGEIENELRRLLRVERLIFIPKEPYDPIGHADGMVRFVDDTTVVVNDYTAVDARFGHRLIRILESAGLRVETLPYEPECRRYDGIESAAGNYVNFLRVGNLLIVPSYGTPTDQRARERLLQLCPGTIVESLPSLNLAREGGVLQCATWTVQV